MGMNELNEVLPDTKNRAITGSTLLKVGEQYYQTQVLLPSDFRVNAFESTGIKDFKLNEGLELSDQIAYLIGDYYYMYRGKLSDVKGFEKILPGIYYDDEKCIYVVCDPETEEEKTEYQYSDKITRYDADEIRNAVLNHEVVIFNTPDTSHSAIPPESLDDDILKKMIKRAIKYKGVDLDQYKIRFASKNMLFNTKQVLRGPNRLSMLLFDRCTEALNLKYTIILEEAGGEIIGHPLKGKIEISSQDVFDANMEREDEGA